MTLLTFILGAAYLIFYSTFSLFWELVLFISLVLLIDSSYNKASNNGNHNLKLALLLLLIGLMLIPKLFLSQTSSFISNVVWAVITFGITWKALVTEIKVLVNS